MKSRAYSKKEIFLKFNETEGNVEVILLSSYGADLIPSVNDNLKNPECFYLCSNSLNRLG